jgi:DNA-binding MarR family transcriptional regulator
LEQIGMAGLKQEISQQRPFASLEEEALLNLLHASDGLNRALHLAMREWGVTSTQYNVLRILRGAQPEGLTCSEIGSRMIAAEPDITRLLGRLKTLKLIVQHRDRSDGRVVRTRISTEGIELLRKMDPMILCLPGRLLGELKQAELAELIRMLELVRGHGKDAGQPEFREESGAK